MTWSQVWYTPIFPELRGEWEEDEVLKTSLGNLERLLAAWAMVDYTLNKQLLCMVVHAHNPSTREAEAGGLQQVQGQPCLDSEFQDSQGFVERLGLRNTTN